MAQSQLNPLLKNNILAEHSDNTYTFHDRHTATWFNRENGEIPDDRAVEFLIENGVRVDDAKLAVANLTGGVFVPLQGFASEMVEGKTYDQLAKQYD